MDWKGWSLSRLCCSDLNNQTGSAHFLTCAGNIGKWTVKFPFIYFETPLVLLNQEGEQNSILSCLHSWCIHFIIHSQAPILGRSLEIQRCVTHGSHLQRWKGEWVLDSYFMEDCKVFKHTGLTTWQTCVCIPSLKHCYANLAKWPNFLICEVWE